MEIPSNRAKPDLPCGSPLWQLKPLVLAGQEPTGIGGGCFQDFLEAFWIESGALVFWATVKRGRKTVEGLFSSKNGEITALLTDRGDINPALQGQISGRLRVVTMLDPWGTVKASPGLVYIAAKIKTGWFTSDQSVFCWDGERLRQVLGRGDEIEGHPIRSAQMVAVGPKGGAAIFFVTTEPAQGLALHDGTAVTAVWRNGDFLPVPPVWRFNFLPDTPVALPSPEVAILLLDFEDPFSEKSKRVLLRLTREKAESIIAVGEPCAALPPRTVATDIEPRFVALSPDCVVFSASSRVLLYDRGRVLSLASAEGCDLTVTAAALLRATPPFVVLACRQFHVEQVGTTQTTRHRVDVALFDGERVVKLTNDFAFDTLEGIRVCPYPFRGAIVEGVRGIPTGEGELEPEKNTSKWFLDINAIDKGLQAPPQLATSEGRVVSLGDVVAWVNPGEAIVKLRDGFHMLSRLDERGARAPASDVAG